MQRPRALVAIHIRDLGEPNRQIAVAALLARVDEDVHGTVHRLDAIAHVFRFALAGRHSRKLIRGVQRQMSGTQEQLLARDMGRVDELIAAREDHILDEAAQLEVQDRALGVPQNQPRPDVFLDREEVELLTDDTVVTLARFLEPPDVALEIVFREPRRPVDALEHLASLVAAPIRARRVQQLEELDAAGAGHVGAAAQIDERAVGIDRDHFVGAEIVDPFEFQRVVDKSPFCFFSTHFFTREEIILLRDLGHFLFDGLEVFRRKRPPDVEVVVEPILDRRTEPDLRLGKELAHRSRQHVRR